MSDERIDALADKVDKLADLVMTLAADKVEVTEPTGPSPVNVLPDPETVSEVYDEALEKAQIQEARDERERVMDEATLICEDLLPMILPKRDQETFKWMRRTLGKSSGELVQSILKASIVRERRNEREAKGGGGASSTNLERLQERL